MTENDHCASPIENGTKIPCVTSLPNSQPTSVAPINIGPPIEPRCTPANPGFRRRQPLQPKEEVENENCEEEYYYYDEEEEEAAMELSPTKNIACYLWRGPVQAKETSPAPEAESHENENNNDENVTECDDLDAHCPEIATLEEPPVDE